MLFQNYLILLRGGGDLATGVAWRLHHAGFPVVVAELPRPLVVRRRVALAWGERGEFSIVAESTMTVATVIARGVLRADGR